MVFQYNMVLSMTSLKLKGQVLGLYRWSTECLNFKKKSVCSHLVSWGVGLLRTIKEGLKTKGLQMMMIGKDSRSDL